MPPFSDWLQGSWEDFRRRWGVLLGVMGVTGIATMVAGFVPFVPAALASAFGVGPAWVVWTSATVVSLLAVLWLSTWGQAALIVAAQGDEPAGKVLSLAWSKTPAFAWTLTLVLLALSGGWFLFLLPGLLLSVMLFSAPFVQAAGEAEGLAALGVSWARVRPRFGAVALRLFAAGVFAAAPGYIPYVGWLVMMFWAPFGVVATARLARDLREAEPAPAAPSWLGGLVAALSVVFVAGTAAVGMAAQRAYAAAAREFGSPDGAISRLKPETMQAALQAMAGDDESAKRAAFAEVLKEMSPTGSSVTVSTDAAGGVTASTTTVLAPAPAAPAAP